MIKIYNVIIVSRKKLLIIYIGDICNFKACIFIHNLQRILGFNDLPCKFLHLGSFEHLDLSGSNQKSLLFGTDCSVTESPIFLIYKFLYFGAFEYYVVYFNWLFKKKPSQYIFDSFIGSGITILGKGHGWFFIRDDQFEILLLGVRTWCFIKGLIFDNIFS